MTLSVRKYVALPLLAMLVAMGGSVENASARSLFDMLFGGNRDRRVERQQPPPPPKPIAVPKISSPRYYDYSPDKLTRIEFAPVIEAEAAKPAPYGRAGSGFAEARAALEGFELFAETDIATAVSAHYAENPRFIWVTGFYPNARADEALDVLHEAEEWGLVTADYSVSKPAASYSLDAGTERMAELMRFEMALTARVLRYMRDANGGRVVPDKLSGYHDFEPKALNLDAALRTLSNTRTVRGFMEMRHPRNGQFARLRAKLADLKTQAERDIVVDPKIFVRPGQSNEEFPKILTLIDRKADEAFRAEHGAVLEKHMGSELYDNELIPVIKAAQAANDLGTDGIIGPRTVAALAGVSKADRIDKVILAMERLRWHPSDLGPRNVVINAASFMATYTEGGKPKLTMRTVVGQRSNQTYFFKDKVEYIEFNPYCGVPRSIMINEMRQSLIRDPGYLDRSGYVVTDRRGRRVSSASINWGQYGADIPFDVRQKPGKSNALGELKIMFPNRHAIYMHDTPAKHLFDNDSRAYSHGCVRLSDPRAMAAAVMGWTGKERVVEHLNRGHHQVDVPENFPVYVAYFTAWPDDAGEIGYYPDVYGRDDRLKTAMEKTSEMRAPSS